MKINSGKKTSKKAVLVAVSAAGLLAIALGGYGLYSSYNYAQNASEVPEEPASNINYNPPTDEEKQAATDQKQEVVSKGEEQANTTTTTSITVSISRARQSEAGKPVSVRTIINGTNSGKCTMTFSKSGQESVVQEVDITFEAASAYCNADFEVSKFSVSGDWTVSIAAQKGSSISEPVTRTVSIAK